MKAREHGPGHEPLDDAAEDRAVTAVVPEVAAPGAGYEVPDAHGGLGRLVRTTAAPSAGAPAEPRPAPGEMPVVMAALAIGLLLMAVQLWLLTVALDLYMAGAGQRAWQPALASGAIFLGGLLMLWLLRARRMSWPVMSALSVPVAGSSAAGTRR
jgi:hypothetical protein